MRLRKLNEFKVTGVYRKAVHRKTTTQQFVIWWKSDMMKKMKFLIAYIDTHQKRSYLSEICVSVDNICSNKLWRNAEERFCLEIVSWGHCSGNKNKPPSMINHMLPSLFLELGINYPQKPWNRRTQEKFISTTDAYLEPVKYLRRKLLARLFSPKSPSSIFNWVLNTPLSWKK